MDGSSSHIHDVSWIISSIILWMVEHSNSIYLIPRRAGRRIGSLSRIHVVAQSGTVPDRLSTYAHVVDHECVPSKFP
jgi:hypothetical protein